MNEGQNLFNKLSKEKKEFEEKTNKLKEAAEECTKHKEDIQISLEITESK